MFGAQMDGAVEEFTAAVTLYSVPVSFSDFWLCSYLAFQVSCSRAKAYHDTLPARYYC